MSENALSAQGTLLYHQPGGTGPFALVAEVRDISGPELMRNTIEVTSQEDVEDAYVVGIRRKNDITTTLGWRGALASHQALRDSWEAGTRDVFKLEMVDDSVWLFSGFVTALSPQMPIDDGFTMDLTIKATGRMTFIDP